MTPEPDVAEVEEEVAEEVTEAATEGEGDGEAEGGADADGTSTYTGGLIARRKLKKPTKRLRSNGKGFARRV